MISYLYTLTNIVNGKVYVGVSKEPYRRYEEHLYRAKSKKSKLSRAMYKHGLSSFNLVVYGPFKEEIVGLLESSLITKLDSHKNGYNSSLGGESTCYYKPWNKDSKGICKPNKTSFKLGDKVGEKHGRSKISDAQRLEVFKRYNNGEDLKEIAPEYGVHWTQLYRAVKFIERLTNENKKYKRQPKGIRKKERPRSGCGSHG